MGRRKPRGGQARGCGHAEKGRDTMSLPAATDTGAHPDGPPPPPEADAAVAAVRALLIDLHAPADLPGRVTTWALQDGTTRVYVPALPLDVAWRLAALGGAS